MANAGTDREASPWRVRLRQIIFEADTLAGKAFDIALLVAILLSVIAVSLETVEKVDREYHRELMVAEWFFTIIFTVEYVLRLISFQRPRQYAVSFFGLVDLVSILPTYLSLLIPGSQALMVIRTLRLLRVFRVLKLGHFLSEADVLRKAVWEARAKIIVFLTTVLVAVTIMGTAMYLVEGNQATSHFTSIPQSMYWAVVTMTTVGYGDVVPQTTIGKILAAMLILFGYSLIIVPTGFVSAELIRTPRKIGVSTRSCPSCVSEGHDLDALFCKYCGEKLSERRFN